jgi:glycerol uptake facilitator-like aquaporin
LAAGYFENHLVYWIGPGIGGAVAALLYHHLLMPKSDAK